MPEVTMPRLSDSMEEGTILRWLKSDGDEVKNGEEIAEIETDKATMTYEADAEGTLHIVADEGSTLAIGELIATIGEDAPPKDGGSSNGSGEKDEEEAEAGASEESGEDDDAGGSDEDAGGDEDEDETPADDTEPDEDNERGAVKTEAKGDDGGDEQAEEPKADASQNGSGGGDGERVKASPVARRLAKEQGVDLGSLEGTGPGGRIVKADVEKAASGDGAPAKAEGKDDGGKQAEAKDDGKKEEKDGRKDADREAEPAAASSASSPGTSDPKVTETGTNKGDVSVVELTRTQSLVARRMAESKATIPDFTLTTEVDMDRAVELRKQLKEVAGEDGVVPSYNDMVVKAAGVALREFPRANGSFKDGKFELYSRVNVGVAVAAQDSLVVPVVHDADGKSLGEIARTVRKLAARVRDGTIRPPDLSGGTFTVSNLGMYGVSEFTAVINSPQAAILAVGSLEEKPVVKDGEVGIGNRMRITIVCDHRILYGADAAEFLKKLRELLEEPLSFAL